VLQDIVARRIALRAAAAAERHRLARAIYVTALAERVPGIVLDDFLADGQQQPTRDAGSPEGYVAEGLHRSKLASQAVSRSKGRGGTCAMAVQKVLLPSGNTGVSLLL
jgi:hypothetical protein